VNDFTSGSSQPLVLVKAGSDHKQKLTEHDKQMCYEMDHINLPLLLFVRPGTKGQGSKLKYWLPIIY
jgi:hypothetical protein